MSTRSTRTSTSTPTSSNASPADPLPPPLGAAGRVGVIVLMALGSVAMWLGVPFGLIYLVSQHVSSTQPTLGPYLVILVGVPLGMTVIGKGLGALDRYYGRRTGTLQQRRRAAWLKSMRGERDEPGGSWRVLDAVMLWSVGTAVLCFAVWFFFFAGASI
jgi:multisubunit Na+/H+ antiporter MnhB subunit